MTVCILLSEILSAMTSIVQVLFIGVLHYTVFPLKSLANLAGPQPPFCSHWKDVELRPLLPFYRAFEHIKIVFGRGFASDTAGELNTLSQTPLSAGEGDTRFPNPTPSMPLAHLNIKL